jgi:ligand-binding SRPBCC domain-containing protein
LIKIHKLQRSQFVPRPRDEVFEFFSNPKNLEKLTPKELSFQILTPGFIPMHVGTVIDYSISLFGLPMRWTSLITRFKESHYFVDLQMRGPYAYWHHLHRFEVVPEGTLIEDEVHYQMPHGFLGEFIHQCYVKKQLEALFDHRERVMKNCFAKKNGGEYE